MKRAVFAVALAMFLAGQAQAQYFRAFGGDPNEQYASTKTTTTTTVVKTVYPPPPPRIVMQVPVPVAVQYQYLYYQVPLVQYPAVIINPPRRTLLQRLLGN